MTLRQSRQRRGCLHVEANAKSRTAMRQAFQSLLNHWTMLRYVGGVVMKANQTMRGWAGYFNFRNNSVLMSDLRRSSEDRLGRCLRRKHGCTLGQWKGHLSERSHTHYGIYALPITAAW